MPPAPALPEVLNVYHQFKTTIGHTYTAICRDDGWDRVPVGHYFTLASEQHDCGERLTPIAEAVVLGVINTRFRLIPVETFRQSHTSAKTYRDMLAHMKEIYRDFDEDMAVTLLKYRRLS
jgi:hypothetical protein